MDDTPVEKEKPAPEEKASKPAKNRQTKKTLAAAKGDDGKKVEKQDDCKNDEAEEEEKRTEKRSKPELTFEEEWQFGGGGGGGSKSGDLKADGDLLTRRGVKRGQRNTKKAIAKPRGVKSRKVSLPNNLHVIITRPKYGCTLP